MENVIKNAECINRKEYDDKKAQEIGFKDYADRRREQIKEWRHETGRSFPKELNEDCSAFWRVYRKSYDSDV